MATLPLPAPLARAIDAAALLRDAGALSDPLAFARRWRERRGIARLERALEQHRLAGALLLAHRSGLLGAIDDEPRAAEDLGRPRGIDADAAETLLRVLESFGLARRAGAAPGRPRWIRTPLARAWLVDSGPFATAGMLDLAAAQAEAFAELPARLADGSPPAALDIFAASSACGAMLDAVNGYLHWAAHDFLRRARLPRIGTFVVGSMGVSFSAALLGRVPDSRVTYGCLAHLVREIPRLRRRFGVPAERVDGMHDHSGDPDADRWGAEAFDLVLLTKKMILRPSENLGARFARKALSVLRPGGVAVLWETVHPDEGPTRRSLAEAASLDLAVCPGGPVLTRGGLRRSLLDLGYAGVDFVPCLDGRVTFAVARKDG